KIVKIILPTTNGKMALGVVNVATRTFGQRRPPLTIGFVNVADILKQLHRTRCFIRWNLAFERRFTLFLN
ncbi:MAG TPA: hypothetical protein DDY13_08315, partial [Cytophagales bacterium]|nr:hypothetical protein [Cytophagales bacterium]